MTKSTPLALLSENGELKAIDFAPWGGLEGFLTATSTGGDGSRAAQLKRISPWLYRAISMTANAVASLPFNILDDGGKVVDSSKEWTNKAGGMEKPQRLVYLVASSLCGGEAYLLPSYTGKLIVDLQYASPNNITPQFNTPGTGELTGFQRFADHLNKNQVVYFWLPDSDVEIGPALAHPIGTAITSAALLFANDATLKVYADRGFVPATILSVKGVPDVAIAKAMEHWWTRFLRRWTDTDAKVLNADTTTVSRVGAGLEELKSVYNEITKQQIENIGAAFGIPAAIFMSDRAYATEIDTLVKQWYETSEFQKIYKTIEETFSEQVLKQYGYTWKFDLDSLDIYKVDEQARAQAYATYVGAKMKPSVAAEILGIDLPIGMEYEELDKIEPLPVQPLQPGQKPPGATTNQTPSEEKPSGGFTPTPMQKAMTLDADEIKELNLWRQRATVWFRKGKGAAAEWECKFLPDEIADGIRRKLAQAQNELDIVKSFEIAPVTETPAPQYNGEIIALAESINGLAAAKSRTLEIPSGKPGGSLVEEFVSIAFKKQGA